MSMVCQVGNLLIRPPGYGLVNAQLPSAGLNTYVRGELYSSLFSRLPAYQADVAGAAGGNRTVVAS